MNLSSWRSVLSFITSLLRIVAVLCGIGLFLAASGGLPALPSTEYLTPLNTFLGAVIALLASLGTGRVSDTLPGAPSQAKHKRNRTHILGEVKTYWIEGFLKNSLHKSVLLERDMTSTSVAVEPRRLLRLPEQSDRRLSQGTKIIDVFDKVDGALLILGEPGSGKTISLLELTRSLIERAEQNDDQQMPIVFNLSRWVKKQLSISEWLVDELNIQYLVSKDLAKAWIDDEEVRPLLDGLDEVSKEDRTECVKAINQFRQEHRAVDIVVCSRTDPYNDLDTRLDLNGAIILQPLTLEQIEDYLIEVGGKPGTVRTTLRQDTQLQELLQTPLMLNIMCFLPDEVVASRGTPEERRKQLFDHYVTRMLEEHRKLERPLRDQHDTQQTMIQRMLRLFSRHDSKRDYSPQQTVYWLSWLACMMHIDNQTIFLMEQIQPMWLSDWPRLLLGSQPRLYSQLRLYKMVFFLAGGLAGGLAMSTVFILPLLQLEYIPAIAFKNLGAVLVIILVTASFAQGKANDDIKIQDALSWSWTRAILVTVGLQTLMLVVDSAHGIKATGSWSEVLDMQLRALPIYAGFTLPLLIIGGISRSEVASRRFPNQGIRRQARNAFLIGVSITSSLSLGLWLAWSIADRGFTGWNVLLDNLPLGLIVGASVALYFGGYDCIKHTAIHLTLWLHGHMPWNCPAFLDYAKDCVFLRSVGGGYMFIHGQLLDHFADHYLATLVRGQAEMSKDENESPDA